MKFEFEEDRLIYEALRMFGLMTPPQIAKKISMREDISNLVKDEYSTPYTCQKRCLMMVRHGLIKEADVEGDKTPEGVWRYYRL